MNRVAMGMFGFALLAGACGTEKQQSGNTTDNKSEFMTGFEPGTLKPGYTRFVGPIIKDIAPGADVTWCQYITPAFDKDQDVIETEATQSKYGHHAVAYATDKILAAGTSRECLTADGLSITLLGGAGGEGVQNVAAKLPPGVVFRIHKGQALMANVHFINTSSQPIDGQAVLDLKLEDPSPDRQEAGLFTNVGTTFHAPAGMKTGYDTSCIAQQDMQLFMTGNHMHEWGFAAFTEVTHVEGGVTESLRRDDTWRKEYTFSPEFNVFSAGNYIQVKKGDTIHTHCEWENTQTQELTFPTEMCVGMGFYLPGGAQINCVDGEWGSGSTN